MQIPKLEIGTTLAILPFVLGGMIYGGNKLADALIGATAISYGTPILTANDKRYKILKDLQIKKFRP